MNAVVYGPTRTLQLVLRVTGAVAGVLLCGRFWAVVSRQSSFVPDSQEITCIGTFLLFYYFALVKACWAWANGEIDAARQGYPVDYRIAASIHFAYPMSIIFFVLSLIAHGAEKNAGASSVVGIGIPLGVLFLLYQAIAGPITEWTSKQKKMDRMMGDVAMKKAPPNQSPPTITPKFIPPQNSTTPNQQPNKKVEPTKKIRLD